MSFDHTIKKATTSKIIEVMIRDSSTGAGKASVAHGDVTASYVREAGSRTAITLASGSAGDSYSSGKWAEVDGTNTPGLYQLHLPDATLATGADAVTVFLKASGVIDRVIRISLIDADLRNSTTLGISNLDASISSRSTLGESSVRTALGYTALFNLDDQVTVIQSAVTANNTAITTVDTVVDAIKAVTDNLPDSGALTSIATASALSTVDTVVDGIKSVTDNLPNSGALSDLATASALTTVDTVVDSIKVVADNLPDSGALTSLATASALTTVDTVVDAIKVVTDALPNSGALSDLASAANLATVDAVVDAIKVVTDSLPNGGALSDLATAAALATTDSVADANKVILDKVDSALESDGSVYRLTTNALEQAPTGGGGSGGVVGSGSTSHEVTVNVAGSPEAGVDVWVSTDSAGTNVVAGTLVTDAFGKATFMLDPGTYYLYAQKAGANFTNPTTFTVS